MDNNQLKEKWSVLKPEIKKQYPDLTDEDLEYEIGKEEDLVLRLQHKLGKNRKEIDNWLDLMG